MMIFKSSVCVIYVSFQVSFIGRHTRGFVHLWKGRFQGRSLLKKMANSSFQRSKACSSCGCHKFVRFHSKRAYSCQDIEKANLINPWDFIAKSVAHNLVTVDVFSWKTKPVCQVELCKVLRIVPPLSGTHEPWFKQEISCQSQTNLRNYEKCLAKRMIEIRSEEQLLLLLWFQVENVQFVAPRHVLMTPK